MFPTDAPIRSRLIKTILGPYIEGDCDKEVLSLFEGIEDRPAAEQCRIAREVLVIRPENIEALTVLGVHAESAAERLAILSRAVRIGAGMWTPTHYVDWWEHLGTRPFMRALCCYGTALAEAGHIKAAERCFRALIWMHPDDALGARHLLKELADPAQEVIDALKI